MAPRSTHPAAQAWATMALFELAAASIAGFRAALDGLDFTEVQTPKVVASATEVPA